MNFGGDHSAHGLQFGQARGAADRASPDGSLPLPLEGPGGVLPPRTLAAPND